MFLHMILKIKLFKYKTKIMVRIISENKKRQRLSKRVLDKYFNVNIIIIINILILQSILFF
jgi:hypothetical protein